MGARNGFRWPTKPPLGTTIDGSHPLARGLVAAWPCNEGAGPAAGDSAGRSPLALTSPAWAAGSSGPELSLAGAGYGVTAAGVAVPAAFSVAVEVTPGASTAAFARILETQYATGFALTADSGGSQFSWFVCDSGGSNPVSGGAVVAGRRTRLLATYDGAASSLYVDGVLVASGARTPPGPTSLPAYLGTYYATPGSFTWGGRVGHAYLWGRALAPSDARSLAENPYAVFLAPNARRFFAPAAAGGGPTYYAIQAGGQQYVVQT